MDEVEERKQLLKRLGGDSPKLKIIVQHVNEHLLEHLEGFFNTLIISIRFVPLNPDVIIFTGIKEDVKDRLNQIMSDKNYTCVAFITQIDLHKNKTVKSVFVKDDIPFELRSVVPMIWSSIQTDETTSIVNGPIILDFFDEETKTHCEIGVVDMTYMELWGNELIEPLVINEWSEMAFLSKNRGIKWFGNFNVNNSFLKLATENEELAQAFRDVGLAYTNLPDCFIDGKAYTLCKAAGRVNIYSLHHPITFKDVMSMSYEQVNEYSNILDFSRSCSNHMTLFCNTHFE